jgi:glycosyltransferase involved in cell wall biosynthesis
MKPLVSVVLPTYNCPKYVASAIESVLSQSFRDFELLVIDDGSTDETPDVVNQYVDPRVRVVTQSNAGLATTLNRGIELAAGSFIARMDQDDWSFPHRLARQVEYLMARPDCALVGTWAEIWVEGDRTDRLHSHPSGNEDLQFQLLLNNPFVHSSVMIRRAALDRVGGYATDKSRQPPEDYELWSRIAREFEVGNIPERLHVYREVQGSMSRQGRAPFLDHLVTISAENIAWASRGHASDPNVVNIAAVAHGADERVVGRPDFRAMRARFRQAVATISRGEHQRLRREGDHLIDVLQHQWNERRHPNDWRRYAVRARTRVRRLIANR